MSFTNPSNETGAERPPLLDRRSKPEKTVKVGGPSLERNQKYLQDVSTDQALPKRLTKPKLTLVIPRAEGCAAKYVKDIQGNPNPVLEDGVVNTGEWDTSPDDTAARMSERWIYTLQCSGDFGWNDYIHWHTVHPGMRPQEDKDDCPCKTVQDDSLETAIRNFRLTSHRSPKDDAEANERFKVFVGLKEQGYSPMSIAKSFNQKEWIRLFAGIQAEKEAAEKVQQEQERLAKLEEERLAKQKEEERLARQEEERLKQEQKDELRRIEAQEDARRYLQSLRELDQREAERLAQVEAEKLAELEAERMEKEMREQRFAEEDAQLIDDGVAVRIGLLVVFLGLWWFSREALIKYLG